FHFLLLSAYVLKPGTYSSWYAYPFFHQSWNLFVPPPSNNYNLFAIYENKGKQTADIFTEILVKHQTNRIGGSEALLLALSNTIHVYEKGNEPAKDSIGFKFIERFAKNYLNKTRNISLDHVKLILVVDQNSPANTRIYTN
ncbi:MAG: hypothetical protein ACXVNO_11575, partial [Bacteroidia bacterium]